MKETQQKKLGNQIIRKVISSLAIVFLLSCIGINYFALKQLTTLANDAFENVVFGLQKNIDDSNINFELTDDTMQKEIEGFSSKIDEFADNIKFFSDRMLIVTNSGSKYSYIYGFDKDNTYSMGEEVKNPDSVITQIFETGIYPKNEITIHNLIIERSIDCYFPLTDEKGNTVIIVTNIKLGLIAGLFGLISGVLAVILIVVLAIVKIVIGIVVKSEMVQMTLFSNRIEEISNMEGDLTKRIQIKSNNEFGFMAKNINRLIDTVQTIISKVMETTDFLNRSTKEFECLMEQTEDNSKTIKHSVDMNKKGIEVRSQSTQMVNTKVIDINDAVEHVASQIEQVAAMADESSSEAKSSQLLMADMNQLINESVQQVNDTSSKVGLLKIQSAQISTVIDSIHNISKQTNLLALNAAIEAARYTKGENGFAVVAEEIRKLASESARQADLIEKLIVGVQDSVDTTQYSMNNTLSIIGRVSENIQVLESQNENIVSTIASVAVMVNEVNKATVAIKTGSDCVKVEVMEISNFYDQNDKAIEEMMNQTINQIGNIQSMSEHMKQMAEVSDQLFEMIHRLKV